VSHKVSVHPHVRGEMSPKRLRLLAEGGSSPRAWGNGRVCPQFDPVLRFIPTCVGKWIGDAMTGVTRKVHPHVRGEMVCARAPRALTGGSSPRAWGNAAD